MDRQPGECNPILRHPIFADACGNTFIIFDCMDHPLSCEEWENIKEVIWSHFPQDDVDNVLVLRKVEQSSRKIKIKMHVLDPYGTEADFCGNGARAIGAYLHKKALSEDVEFCLVSRFGEHRFFYVDRECFVEMGMPKLADETISFILDCSDYQFQLVDSIEPHLVTSDFFDVEQLKKLGYEINLKYRKRFPEGVNVNCYRQAKENAIEILTFERGLYKITAACGTGSAACTQVALKHKMIHTQSNITIYALGGQLKIYQIGDVLWLGGPVILREYHEK